MVGRGLLGKRGGCITSFIRGCTGNTVRGGLVLPRKIPSRPRRKILSKLFQGKGKDNNQMYISLGWLRCFLCRSLSFQSRSAWGIYLLDGTFWCPRSRCCLVVKGRKCRNESALLYHDYLIVFRLVRCRPSSLLRQGDCP